METNRPTDQPTDGPSNIVSYRGATLLLKSHQDPQHPHLVFMKAGETGEALTFRIMEYQASDLQYRMTIWRYKRGSLPSLFVRL
jgi:hypothetical protein